MKKAVRYLAAMYIVALAGFALGAILVFIEVWPHSTLKEIDAFVAGDPTEKTTTWEKVQSDAGLTPARYLHPREEFPAPEHEEYTTSKIDIVDHQFSDLRAAPIYVSKTNSGGWLINGIFDFKSGLHGYLLVEHDGSISKSWQLPDGEQSGSREQRRVNGLGLALLQDGSFISRSSDKIFRMSWCGDILWQIEGEYHHSVSLDGQGGFWAWRGDYLVALSVEDGSIQNEIHIEEVIRANPDISAFEILTNPGDWKWADQTNNTKIYARSQKNSPVYLQDPFHQNDVDPLREEIVGKYPIFNTGDLLVSMRHLNLVFVVRPSTKKIIWFRQGLTSRQHDPDWNADGTITVFDNRNHHSWSRVAKLSLDKNQARTIVDGETYGIYTVAGGDHEVYPNGSVLMISRNQGRVTHVSKDGAILFDFVNRYNDEKVLRLFNAIHISEKKMTEWNTCKN